MPDTGAEASSCKPLSAVPYEMDAGVGHAIVDVALPTLIVVVAITLA